MLDAFAVVQFAEATWCGVAASQVGVFQLCKVTAILELCLH